MISFVLNSICVVVQLSQLLKTCLNIATVLYHVFVSTCQITNDIIMILMFLTTNMFEIENSTRNIAITFFYVFNLFKKHFVKYSRIMIKLTV